MHRFGVVPINTDFDKSLATFRKSLTLDDALDAMEERQAYVVVNNPENDREYRPIIEGLLGELACCTDSLEPYMNWYSTYLFISAHRLGDALSHGSRDEFSAADPWHEDSATLGSVRR